MAFAAVVSLMNTIHLLLNSHRISIVSPTREIIEFAYEEVKSLGKALERLDTSRNRSARVKALEEQMREAVCRLEDVLESRVSNQILSQSGSLTGDEGCLSILSLDLQELRQDIDCFTQRVKKMEEEYTKELDNPLPEKEDDDAAVSSRTDFDGNESKMVGLSDEFCEIKDRLVRCWYTTIASIVGMAGIGKTTLAKKIFEDPLISKRFPQRFFVTVGPKAQSKEIQKAILTQVNPDRVKRLMEEDENLDKYFRRSLTDRFLIVLDDVWNADSCNDFIDRLPEQDYGSVILVTTRLQQVVGSLNNSTICDMRFLNKEESWDLLRAKVFAEDQFCPHQLEKAGKKIAENCEGLPLLISTVADLLSKAEKTPEYWNKVAADKENPTFMDAYDQILKVLYPSYNYLLECLKACFLSMAAFPQNYEVRRSRLINLWNAEGFLEPYEYQTSEKFLKKCLMHLVGSNVVVVYKEAYTPKIKAYGLHSVFWNLSKREAKNNKFLYTLNRYVDGSVEGIEGQCRLSIYKNILFGIKNVYNSMASTSTARSLFCTGAYHQYQVPICFGLRLLRVLDALTIRLYDFPMEALKLVQLRYLALTYHGDIPPSISKLWNLQCLIIHQHMSIKSTLAQSYLPIEIWDLQELKYLQIMGRNLPNPCGAVLPNLLSLLDVGTQSCTEEVLESIPNLKKLRVQIMLAPDFVEPQSCFDHISHLRKLKSLQCVIMNPKLKSKLVAPPTPFSIFPLCLKKLSLSGLGYSWEEMSKIASLPNLSVLKLRCFAFEGPKWEIKERGFLSLKFLLIEDSDLVQWIVGGDGTFRYLWFLTMKNCYKLEEIPTIGSLSIVQFVDCNPSVVTYAKQMEADYRRIYVDFSWDDGNLKS